MNRVKHEKYPLDDILEGKFPNYRPWKLKRRLISNEYLREECTCCGYKERRMTDHTVPLILDFIDGNRKNHVYNNLRLLCFNCYFQLVGNIIGHRGGR